MRRECSMTEWRKTRSKRVWIVALTVALALFIAACGEEKEDEPAGGGDQSASGGKDCGKVVLNEQAWAGSMANTYIAKAVLEDELGCEVEITKITESPVYQALADGKTDAALEDWDHPKEDKKYIQEAGTVIDGGPLGVTGHIGWFIPQYLMDEHPEFKTWKGLKGQEELFKTAESGDQGMFLGGDPSYVQKDKELIEALDLNLKHVTAGAEPAQVARWSQAYKQKEPVLFYWYTPQHLNQEYDLAEVKLPPIFNGCKENSVGGDPEQYKCEYKQEILNKLFSKEFAESGSPAYDVLKRMKLTNTDQEQVAGAIAGDEKEDPEKAGQDWVKQNQDKVQQWLGSS
jgi:glycine betaine/proline transport system substrate-binding protein